MRHLTLLLGESPDWVADALCAQVDPEIFFPEKGMSTGPAKTICGRCEVRDECLAHANATDEAFGVWGGLSVRERRRAQRLAALAEAS